VELPRARDLIRRDTHADVQMSARTIATPAAYGVAALSIAYAVAYLGFIGPSRGANTLAVLLSDAFIAVAGVLVTVVAATVGERIAGEEGRWISLVGVGWALLSAAHGAYGFTRHFSGDLQSVIDPTDPRGFATFGLAGVWTVAVGLLARQGRGGLPRGLGAFAVAAGVDLVLLYISTLLEVDTGILVFGGLASVILGPVFWMWMGSALRRSV
jgi:hypothetical protein